MIDSFILKLAYVVMISRREDDPMEYDCLVVLV